MRIRLSFVIIIVILVSFILTASWINNDWEIMEENQTEKTKIKFEDVTEIAGISHIGRSYGSSWGYLNKDGWPDLWQGNHGSFGNGSKIFLNNKNGTFSEFTSISEADSVLYTDNHSASWADFDNDGDQDLLILVGANRGVGSGSNTFLINENDSLIDEAAKYELDYSLGRGRTPLWFDWDNDGLLDVLLVNSQRPDKKAPTVLFHQTLTGFEKVLTIEEIETAPSSQLFDFTGDGKMELVQFVGTRIGIYNLSGSQPENILPSLIFPPTWRDDLIQVIQLVFNLKGDTLREFNSIDWAIADFNGDLHPDLFFVKNKPTKTQYFSDRVQIPFNMSQKEKTQFAIVDKPPACRSMVAGDFDNDMDLDIYLVCTLDTFHFLKKLPNLPNILYENLGNGTFVVVPNAAGAEGTGFGMGESVSMVDYDNDGFLDIYVTNGEKPWSENVPGPSQLFRNLGNSNHWLEIDLVGTISNRDGIGSRVLVNAGDITQVREQTGGIHYRSQNHQRLHFGLGENFEVKSIIVYWPSGVIQELENISANQILKITEPSSLR